MKNLLTSATKLVFLTVAFTVCVGFFMNKVSEQAFLSIATLVFAFYYSKGVDNSVVPTGTGSTLKVSP